MLCKPIVLVTPAFPETGRTVYQGNLFVGSVPLNESPLKDHPLNPMHDSNLVRVLARQSQTKIGLVDLATLARGAEAVRAKLADLARAKTLGPLVQSKFAWLGWGAGKAYLVLFLGALLGFADLDAIREGRGAKDGRGHERDIHEVLGDEIAGQNPGTDEGEDD